MLENLKTIRKEKGFTQSQVADYIGLTRPSYTLIEKGKNQLFYKHAVKIAELFDMTPDEIFLEDFKKKVK